MRAHFRRELKIMIESETSAAKEASLDEFIQEKRKRWQADQRDLRKNRLEGFWMTLSGLVVVSLGFILFGGEVNKTRIMIILLGFSVSVMGIYCIATGQRLPEGPSKDA
jgi:hypothetical protein